MVMWLKRSESVAGSISNEFTAVRFVRCALIALVLALVSSDGLDSDGRRPLVNAATPHLVLLAAKLNLPLGRLPGDIIWRGKNSAFYFPWVTCLLFSLLATLLLWIFKR